MVQLPRAVQELEREFDMKFILTPLFLLPMTGCSGGGSDMTPVGAGLATVGLCLIISKLVERLRSKGDDDE